MIHISSSDRFVEAVGRALRSLSSQEQTEDSPAAAPVPAYTIAMSRQAGTNGAEVARLVGERLAWPVYDRELLERVAAELGLRVSTLESLDERPTNWLERSLGAFAGGVGSHWDAYVHRLFKLLHALAVEGQCIIVGRGAAQVLPRATTLRVRLIGDLPDRIASLQARLGVSADEAKRRLEQIDQERTRFVKDQLHKDPNDQALYDLILNTSRFTAEECATLIVEALRRLQAHKTTKVPATAVS